MTQSRRAEALWREDRACWDIKVQKDGIRKHFTSKIPGRKGKHDAETKADRWLETGTADMRASDAWDLYIEYVKANKSKSVYAKAESLGRLYVVPQLALKKLSKVTPSVWQGCIEAGAREGLSRRSCVNIRAQIVAFAKYARMSRWEIIPIEDGDLTIPQSAPAPKEKHALTDSELYTVFNVDTYPVMNTHGKLFVHRKAHYINAFRFYILTGLRRGELAGLRKTDIKGKILTVSRNVNTFNEITQGKNDNARRSFRLTPTMIKVLEDQRQYLSSVGLSSSPWLFPDRFGERPDPNAIYDNWYAYRTKHGIKGSVHELRHTFISLTKSDLPMELLKAQVGHSSEMDTALVYAHEVDGDRIRTSNIIEKVITKHLKKKYKKPRTRAHKIYKISASISADAKNNKSNGRKSGRGQIKNLRKSL